MRRDRRTGHHVGRGRARDGSGRHLSFERPGRPRAMHLRDSRGAGADRPASALWHLPRSSDPRPGLRREDLQAQVRAPRRESPCPESKDRPGRDHRAEPRVCRRPRALLQAGVRADPREPERRHGGGLPSSGPPRLLGAVPPRGEPRPARQPLSLPRVHRGNGRPPEIAPPRGGGGRCTGRPPPGLCPAAPRDARRLTMPRDASIRSVLVIGSGPIVIGQACEFDYSGTQAIKALRAEGIRVSLVNSNPATIMTDPEYADRTYVEPLTPEVLELILERERPDALLPTVGGQTALNLAVELSKRGILERLGIRLIGASRRAVEVGEDRRLFHAAMQRIGLDVPRSGFARTVEEARAILDITALPAVIRPSFTLGGTGGGIAYNAEEFEDAVERGLDLSPVHEILVE